MTEYRNPLQEILSAVPTGTEPIHVYFTGDEDAPDRFGTVYDTEDEALEVAHENLLHVWRVPVVPDWDNAEYIGGGEPDDRDNT